MPGTPRKQSNSGFYHVIVKGNNGRVIFEDDDDRRSFLELMGRAADEFLIKYHAYCLMDNHVHLLVEDAHEQLAVAMSSINRGYTEHFRVKNDHVGTLYTGRFWSEPIENEGYALCTLRYIHQNPQAAGICLTSQYPWSSIGEYLDKPKLCTTDVMLELCGGLDGFIKFHRQLMAARPFPTSRLRSHNSGEEVSRIANLCVGEKIVKSLSKMRPSERAPYLLKLHESGLTAAQVARITGLSKSTIMRAS